MRKYTRDYSEYRFNELTIEELEFIFDQYNSMNEDMSLYDYNYTYEIEGKLHDFFLCEQYEHCSTLDEVKELAREYTTEPEPYTYEAEKMIAHNWDLLMEAEGMFGDLNLLEIGATCADGYIRAYVFEEIYDRVFEEYKYKEAMRKVLSK